MSQFNFLSFLLQIIFSLDLNIFSFFPFRSLFRWLLFTFFSSFFSRYRTFSSLDSAFTERILGLPNENFKGYVEADATQRARHIPSHSFFLLHGLADSSAPYLHGTQLARALAKAGVIFQYQVRMITPLLLVIYWTFFSVYFSNFFSLFSEWFSYLELYFLVFDHELSAKKKPWFDTISWLVLHFHTNQQNVERKKKCTLFWYKHFHSIRFPI